MGGQRDHRIIETVKEVICVYVSSNHFFYCGSFLRKNVAIYFVFSWVYINIYGSWGWGQEHVHALNWAILHAGETRLVTLALIRTRPLCCRSVLIGAITSADLNSPTKSSTMYSRFKISSYIIQNFLIFNKIF